MNILGLNNLFDSVTFSSADIEAQIRVFNLSFDQTRNDRVEWKLKLPMFVPPFYDYIKSRGSIPSQDDYWLFYVSENKDYLVSLNLSREEKIGLRARVYRTYPSLVRDFHFGLYLKENNFFCFVFYNEILDIEYGIDLVIENEERTLIGLNLFTQTQAAQYARKVKEFRPKKSVNFACLEIPIDFKGSKTCGDFFLYSDREITSIVEKIKNHTEAL